MLRAGGAAHRDHRNQHDAVEESALGHGRFS
jgi:hypothetical protein